MDKHFGSEAENTTLWHMPRDSSQAHSDPLNSVLDEAENKGLPDKPQLCIKQIYFQTVRGTLCTKDSSADLFKKQEVLLEGLPWQSSG